MKTCALVAALMLFGSSVVAQEAAPPSPASAEARDPATRAAPAETPAPAHPPEHDPAAHSTAASAHEAAETGEHAVDAAPHPMLPDPSETWPGTTVIIIGAMFLAAAVVGPVVRANMPEEIPPAHSHDEPPGASHHHGKSGTLNPEPDHGHGHH
jgi:hypothetical protein